MFGNLDLPLLPNIIELTSFGVQTQNGKLALPGGSGKTWERQAEKVGSLPGSSRVQLPGAVS